jgi:hypothetical protein
MDIKLGAYIYLRLTQHRYLYNHKAMLEEFH